MSHHHLISLRTRFDLTLIICKVVAFTLFTSVRRTALRNDLCCSTATGGGQNDSDTAVDYRVEKQVISLQEYDRNILQKSVKLSKTPVAPKVYWCEWQQMFWFFLFIMCRKIKLLKVTKQKCTVIASSLKMLWGYWVHNGTWTQHCTWLLRLLVKRVSSTNPAVSMTDWICQTPSLPWPLALFSQTDKRLEEIQGRKTAACHWTPRRVWYLHDLKSTTSAARHRQLCLTGLPQRSSAWVILSHTQDFSDFCMNTNDCLSYLEFILEKFIHVMAFKPNADNTKEPQVDQPVSCDVHRDVLQSAARWGTEWKAWTDCPPHGLWDTTWIKSNCHNLLLTSYTVNIKRKHGESFIWPTLHESNHYSSFIPGHQIPMFCQTRSPFAFIWSIRNI